MEKQSLSFRCRPAQQITTHTAKLYQGDTRFLWAGPEDVARFYSVPGPPSKIDVAIEGKSLDEYDGLVLECVSMGGERDALKEEEEERRDGGMGSGDHYYIRSTDFVCM
jgi:hypothetical protein